MTGLFTSAVAKTSAPGFHFNVALARRRARQTIKIKRNLITITHPGQEIFEKFKAQIISNSATLQVQSIQQGIKFFD